MFFFCKHTLHRIPCQEKWQKNVKKLPIERHGPLFPPPLAIPSPLEPQGTKERRPEAFGIRSTAYETRGTGSGDGARSPTERGADRLSDSARSWIPPATVPIFMSGEPQGDAPENTPWPWKRRANGTCANALSPFTHPSDMGYPKAYRRPAVKGLRGKRSPRADSVRAPQGRGFAPCAKARAECG